MSTNINIKKRIQAKEEGVSITNDLSSLNFVGSGITASTVGNDVTVTVPGSIGSTTYYLNQTVTQAPYKEFSSVPTLAAEQDIPTVVGVGTTELLGAYQTPSGYPNTTNIPAGLWQFFVHLYSGVATDDWDVYVEVYKRDLSAVETLIFTTDVEVVTNMPTSTTMYLLDGVFPTTSLLTTDRLVVKVYATNTGSGSQTIHFITEGSAHYSVATTTLNQVVGAGSVTSVTGTAPIASSGGTTPAISISQASGSTDGYLSSTDWTTFNGKQNAITLTTTGTSGAATLIGSTLNIPQYLGGLTYFTEAQSTSAPNATINVDSLTAVASTTDADIALVPKGNGAFLLDIPDSLSTGGNKRGTNAIDLQISRSSSTQVASGNYSVTIGYGNTASTTHATAIGRENIASGIGSVALGYTNTSSGAYSFSVGLTNTASGNYAFSLGYQNTASGLYSFTAGRSNSASTDAAVALGYFNSALNLYSVAIGRDNISSGIGSVALGYGNTASVNYSSVIGGRSNSSGAAYALSGGYLNTSTGLYSIAFGYNTTSNQEGAIAIGYSASSTAVCALSLGQGSTASGQDSVAIGRQNTASAISATAIGKSNTASGDYSVSIGQQANTLSQYGRIAFSSGAITSAGDIQKSFYILKGRSSSASAKTLTLDNVSAGIVLQNNNVFSFKGQIVGKQTGTTNIAVWDIDGVIVRGASAATTALPIGNVNVVINASAWGVPTLTADTVNGGLTVNVIGAAATNIQWIADIQTSEVIY